MNQQSSNTYSIIGGGLAGCFMAARLTLAGQKVVLYDFPKPNSASKVAAGLFNVITGRFGAKTWLADTLLETQKRFLEIPVFQPLKQFVHHQTIYRPFRETSEFNKWQNRSVDDRFKHLFELKEFPQLEDKLINPHGGIDILPCGWIDLKGFLTKMKQILIDELQITLVEEKVDQDQIDYKKKLINTESSSINFDHIIFCEGASTVQNPLFNYLPVIPNKGELLTIQSKELKLPFVLSKKVYLIPLGDDHYLTGSTYQNQFEHPHPTEENKAEICRILELAIKVPYQIIDHKAGIRPTTKDRRPIAGTHPDFPFVHIVTGFGAKGVLLSPYISELMAHFLVKGENILPEEVRIERFAL